MADDLKPIDSAPQRESLSSSAADRRSFLRRAALVGIPVVIASIPSRTVWAGPQPKRPGGGPVVTPNADPTGASQGSFHASGTTNRVQSLL
jgi:hypothetical protein